MKIRNHRSKTWTLANVPFGALALSALVTVAACGGPPPAPTSTSRAPSASPSVRTSAGTIAFVRVLPIWAPVCDIYVVNADGTGLRALDDGPGFKSHPSWSPDGSRVVYAVLPENDEPYEAATIWVVNVDGSGKQRLTADGVRGDMPAWSPDGARIVFSRCSRRTSSYDIAVMDTDGRHLRSLTSSVYDDLYPAWASPSKIVFLRNGAMFSIDSDGGGLAQLKRVGTTHGDFAPSPGGVRIAVTRDASDRLEAVAFPGGGSPLTLLHPVSRFIIQNSHVASDWTADGRKLVVAASSFLHTPYGSLLYIINADGSRRSVVPGVDDAQDPAWQPQ
jgi:dipeptidyl aminopeptidase/acylaminoacyl peptidase